MLILSRGPSEEILLHTSDGDILLRVMSVQGKRVSLGFDAPKSVGIVRTEVYQRQLKKEKKSRANQNRNQQCRGIGSTHADADSSSNRAEGRNRTETKGRAGS